VDWDTAEKISRTFSFAAVPIVVAVGGWLLQRLLQKQSIRRDYVQLAVTILSNAEPSKVPSEIRAWAVDLLNENSPIKLDAGTVERLKSGAITLSGFQFVSSRALTPALKGQLEASLSEFKAYLTKLGFPPMAKRVSVDIRPGTEFKIDEEDSGVAIWDETTNSIIVARAFATDQAMVLRQLAHTFIYNHEAALPWACLAIESGLATYLPCSFSNYPVEGDHASEAGKRVRPPTDLRNRRRFDEIQLNKWPSIQGDGSGVWGGAFWQIRELLGSEEADRLLAQTWQEFSTEKQEDKSAYVAFASSVLGHLRSGNDDISARVRAVFEERGLRL
jgi:hypothetical protein